MKDKTVWMIELPPMSVESSCNIFVTDEGMHDLLSVAKATLET